MVIYTQFRAGAARCEYRAVEIRMLKVLLDDVPLRAAACKGTSLFYENSAKVNFLQHLYGQNGIFMISVQRQAVS